MVGHAALDRRIGVRIPASQPFAKRLLMSATRDPGLGPAVRVHGLFARQTAARSAQGSAKTNRLLPELGRSSGVSPDRRAADRLPVLAATYWRPSTA